MWALITCTKSKRIRDTEPFARRKSDCSSTTASFIRLRFTPCDDYTTSYSKLTTVAERGTSRGTSQLHRAVELSELRCPSFRIDAVTWIIFPPARVSLARLFPSSQSQPNRSSQVARLCIRRQRLAFLSNLNPPNRREFARNLTRERHECSPIPSTECPSLIALRHATRHLARSAGLFTTSLRTQSQERFTHDSPTIHRSR